MQRKIKPQLHVFFRELATSVFLIMTTLAAVVFSGVGTVTLTGVQT